MSVNRNFIINTNYLIISYEFANPESIPNMNKIHSRRIFFFVNIILKQFKHNFNLFIYFES